MPPQEWFALRHYTYAYGTPDLGILTRAIPTHMHLAYTVVATMRAVFAKSPCRRFEEFG